MGLQTLFASPLVLFVWRLLLVGGALSLASREVVAAESGALADRLRPIVGVPGGLTADGVARAAASSSPLVAERRAQLEEAAGRLERAKVALAPTLALNGRYTRLS